MNRETCETVHEGDLPQVVRNIIRENDETKDATDLKIQINSFLWCHLPMRTTLREGEIMACKIFCLMTGVEYKKE